MIGFYTFCIFSLSDFSWPFWPFATFASFPYSLIVLICLFILVRDTVWYVSLLSRRLPFFGNYRQLFTSRHGRNNNKFQEPAGETPRVPLVINNNELVTFKISYKSDKNLIRLVNAHLVSRKYGTDNKFFYVTVIL